jgi:hypothetical protein
VKPIQEIRDPEEARLHLLSGLRLARAPSLSETHLQDVLAWAMEIAHLGAALPSLGFVSDVGRLVLGQGDHRSASPAQAAAGGIDWRRYEDHVLGKLYADRSFQRASDALAHYSQSDRPRALAFSVRRFHERLGAAGVVISPAVVRSLQKMSAGQVIAECQKLEGQHISPRLAAEYGHLISASRDLGDALDAADVFELEHRTALAEFADRLALRQTLLAMDELVKHTPAHKPRFARTRAATPSRLASEDAYPTGGYSSISHRGTMESLLQSQLAYMEKADRPDLFDVKFLRNELFYYARDESQHVRRRRTFRFLFFPDLALARVKDAGAPCQRVLLAMALMLAAMRKLVDWLGDEALLFEFLFVAGDAPEFAPLSAEQNVLEMILREEIATGLAKVVRLDLDAAAARACEHHGHVETRTLLVSSGKAPDLKLASPPDRLLVGNATPVLVSDASSSEAMHPGAWQPALEFLLRQWL